MPDIHPTAVVDGGARIGANVTVGPYSIVGTGVELAEGVTVMSHVVVNGRTSIGANTKVYPFASVGLAPQDLKYKGEPSRLEIGCNNIIREHVTMHGGTEGGGMVTRVGNNGLFMVACHVAHDCRIGDHVVMVNNATLGGHVMVGDWAILGGLAAVHQYVRIGRHAMVGGLSGVENDVIPYGSVTGNRARLQGLNIVGLKRRGVSRDNIHVLRNAYRLLFAQEGTLAERLEDVAELFHDNRAVMEIIAFIRTESQRSICQPTLEDAA
ncbi:MAG: acyl-ACP--UDP-N-acetylglucosamine O-acyltransferase [Alphaproteobacteria bacterium]|nr:acyl-ACP--UDP-N-acetylglucosamine O-acyltransferase [Alphaproteobacteria bacterium]